MTRFFVLTFLFATLFLSSHASLQPKHFFTQDPCQFWELQDQTTGVVDSVYFLKTDSGIQFKQGYRRDRQNSFFQSWDFSQNTKTQINQYAQEIVLCQTLNFTEEEKQSVVIITQRWETLKNNAVLITEKSDGSIKWLYEGIILRGNHTDAQYVEKDNQPSKLKFYDSKGNIVKSVLVKKFETDCSTVQKEFQNDVKICQKSADVGNSFVTNETRRRGANSVRMPDHEFDLSNPRFASQKGIVDRNLGLPKVIERAKEKDRCSMTGAYNALMRAIETKSTEYGNWCGVGSEKGVCCETVCPDGGYDVLCRKHDSSTYWESWYGVSVSPCMNDNEFLQESQDFNGCTGDASAPWRVDPDKTGQQTCDATRKAAIETFKCIPCLNFECESGKFDYATWSLTTVCDWASYWTSYPDSMACDGECWDSSMKPWGYENYYNVPPSCSP